MSEIDPYILTYVISKVADFKLNDDFVRSSELLDGVEGVITAILSKERIYDFVNVRNISYQFIDMMSENDVIQSETHQFAGKYYAFSNFRYQEFRKPYLSSNEIYGASKRIGARYFPDVFEGYVGSHTPDGLYLPELGTAPGSNRIVTFDHNQISELETATTDVIEAVEQQNQIDEVPGLRELIVGQLKAGREFVRAGSCRLYLLQMTLIEALKFLVKKYEKEIIGSLAGKLIDLILERVGLPHD